MKKEPKPMNFRRLLGRGVKAVIIAEAVGLVATYALWKQMNTSQDFRYKMFNNCPVILESYYQMGEKIGNLPTRKLDYQAWGISDNGK